MLLKQRTLLKHILICEKFAVVWIVYEKYNIEVPSDVAVPSIKHS